MHQYKRTEFKKMLINNNFIYARSRGGHDIYIRNDDEVIAVPTKLSPVITKRLIKEYNLKEIRKIKGE